MTYGKLLKLANLLAIIAHFVVVWEMYTEYTAPSPFQEPASDKGFNMWLLPAIGLLMTGLMIWIIRLIKKRQNPENLAIVRQLDIVNIFLLSLSACINLGFLAMTLVIYQFAGGSDYIVGGLVLLIALFFTLPTIQFLRRVAKQSNAR